MLFEFPLRRAARVMWNSRGSGFFFFNLFNFSLFFHNRLAPFGLDVTSCTFHATQAGIVWGTYERCIYLFWLGRVKPDGFLTRMSSS